MSTHQIEILRAMAEQVGSGNLIFPTNLHAALRIRQTLSNPDCHIDEATRLIQAEPLLSARIVAMANAVTTNRSGRKITDVRSAISRVGFRSLHTMATALITRQLTQTTTEPALKDRSLQLWQHTVQVSTLAQVIARHTASADPETALFAGIVHEMGGFYLISRASAHPGLLDNNSNEAIQPWLQQISRSILKQLMIPSEVLHAIAVSWTTLPTPCPTTLSETLSLAEYLASIASPFRIQISDLTNDTSIDQDEGLAQILTTSATEMHAMRQAFDF